MSIYLEVWDQLYLTGSTDNPWRSIQEEKMSGECQTCHKLLPSALRRLCMRWFPQQRGKAEGHWAVAGIELKMQCCATESHLKMWIWTGKLEVPTVPSVHFSSCRTGLIEHWQDERRQSQTHQHERVTLLQSQTIWNMRIIKLHDERICKDTEVNREYPRTNQSLLKFSLKNAFPKLKIGESVKIMVR